MEDANMSTNPNQVLVNVKDNQCIEIHLPLMRNVEAECAAADILAGYVLRHYSYCDIYLRHSCKNAF